MEWISPLEQACDPVSHIGKVGGTKIEISNFGYSICFLLHASYNKIVFLAIKYGGVGDTFKARKTFKISDLNFAYRPLNY